MQLTTLRAVLHSSVQALRDCNASVTASEPCADAKQEQQRHRRRPRRRPCWNRLLRRHKSDTTSTDRREHVLQTVHDSLDRLTVIGEAEHVVGAETTTAPVVAWARSDAKQPPSGGLSSFGMQNLESGANHLSLATRSGTTSSPYGHSREGCGKCDLTRVSRVVVALWHLVVLLLVSVWKAALRSVGMVLQEVFLFLAGAALVVDEWFNNSYMTRT
jgi:hypothetical protein